MHAVQENWQTGLAESAAHTSLEGERSFCEYQTELPSARWYQDALEITGIFIEQ
ncbi:MAG: hypothetical protein ACLFVU_06405 [Phycisphaerae bacterium]